MARRKKKNSLSCPNCSNKFDSEHLDRYISCISCNKYFHKKCSKIEKQQYNLILRDNLEWTCSSCKEPKTKKPLDRTGALYVFKERKQHPQELCQKCKEVGYYCRQD